MCSINYDAVLKLETLSNDFRNLRSLVPDGNNMPHLDNIGVSLEVPRENEISVVQAHFLQLSEKERRQIYEVYKPDFDLFGYDPNIF